MAKYFAYGSNMNPERMCLRDIAFSRRRAAKLLGYRLVFNVLDKDNNKVGYANIVSQADGAVVEGVLYDIPQSDLIKLDVIEDVPETYRRWPVRVCVDEGEVVEAVTYIGKRTGSDLSPSKEYLGHLLAGSSVLSKEYQRWLRTIETAD